jgi:hypothetical protein
MTKILLIYLLAGALAAQAEVVRLAPNVSWEGAGQLTNLRNLRGQPVVLVVGKSANSRAFRKQVRILEEIYQQFASRQVVFVAAVQEGEPAVHSNIPFAVASNGAKVAADYGIEEGFSIIIIGKDGNVDLQTKKVIPASRVRDVINNSFEVQSAARK